MDGEMSDKHDFHESLAYSHMLSDLPLWEVVYRKAFHNFETMVDHREDGEHQRAGIDRSVILKNSKQILIDEKGRKKAYPDIALEYLSSVERKTPGWACKPLRADYIAYAIIPKGICYLLPVIQMQQAFDRHGKQWISKYFEINAPNNGYTTRSVGVPVDILFSAMGNCLRIKF